MRAQIIVEMLYGLGLRISELQSLAINTVDVDSGFISVLGKGRKTRLLPLTQRLVSLLGPFIQLRKSFVDEDIKDSKNLLLNARKKNLSIRGIRFLLQKELLSHPELQIHPHGLRHTFATHLIENDCDIKKVQDLLGHRSLATTQLYTHLSRDHLRQKLYQYHPSYSKQQQQIMHLKKGNNNP